MFLLSQLTQEVLGFEPLTSVTIFITFVILQARPDSAEWEEMEELPLETRCKIEGMKMMARYSESHLM